MRNEARDTVEHAVLQQIAAQGDAKAMKKFLRPLQKQALGRRPLPNDEARFKAKYGKGI